MKHKIAPQIRDSAYEKYKKLPAVVNKNEFISDAIEEKYDREYGKKQPFESEQIKYLNKYYVRKDDVK